MKNYGMLREGSTDRGMRDRRRSIINGLDEEKELERESRDSRGRGSENKIRTCLPSEMYGTSNIGDRWDGILNEAIMNGADASTAIFQRVKKAKEFDIDNYTNDSIVDLYLNLNAKGENTRLSSSKIEICLFRQEIAVFMKYWVVLKPNSPLSAYSEMVGYIPINMDQFRVEYDTALKPNELSLAKINLGKLILFYLLPEHWKLNEYWKRFKESSVRKDDDQSILIRRLLGYFHEFIESSEDCFSVNLSDDLLLDIATYLYCLELSLVYLKSVHGSPRDRKDLEIQKFDAEDLLLDLLPERSHEDFRLRKDRIIIMIRNGVTIGHVIQKLYYRYFMAGWNAIMEFFLDNWEYLDREEEFMNRSALSKRAEEEYGDKRGRLDLNEVEGMFSELEEQGARESGGKSEPESEQTQQQPELNLERESVPESEPESELESAQDPPPELERTPEPESQLRSKPNSRPRSQLKRTNIIRKRIFSPGPDESSSENDIFSKTKKLANQTSIPPVQIRKEEIDVGDSHRRQVASSTRTTPIPTFRKNDGEFVNLGRVPVMKSSPRNASYDSSKIAESDFSVIQSSTPQSTTKTRIQGHLIDGNGSRHSSQSVSHHSLTENGTDHSDMPERTAADANEGAPRLFFRNASHARNRGSPGKQDTELIKPSLYHVIQKTRLPDRYDSKINQISGVQGI